MPKSRRHKQAARRNRPRYVNGISPDSTIRFVSAADGEGEGEEQRRVELDAYTGGPLSVGWGTPVYIELSGLSFPKSGTPLLLDHQRDVRAIVGQSDAAKVENHHLLAEGPILGDSEQVRAMISLADAGFAWQASVGVSIQATRYIQSQDSDTVNGRTVKGPALVVRKGKLKEISIVSIGADENAQAMVAQDGDLITGKEADMNPKLRAWIEAKGLDVDDLTEERIAELTAEYEAEQAGDDPAPPAPQPAQPAAVQADGAPDLTAQREEVAAEVTRQAAIRGLCAESQPDLCARAIREGWSVEKAELEALRASRPQAPAVRTGGPRIEPNVLTAAALFQSELSGSQVEAMFDEPTLDAADGMRRSGLRGLIEAGCALDGIERPALTASPQEWVRAAFTSSSVTHVLSSSANKLLLEMFTTSAGPALKLFKRVSVNNFLQHTGYRMTGGVMQKVGQGGELQHGTLADSSKTYQAYTYGELIGLTRTMMVNDDLGMFLAMPARLGRDAGETIEDAAWDLVKANTSDFFHADNANLITGADTVLGIAGLDKAVQTLAEQTSNGRPIRVSGRYLVVPPALAGEAARIYTATNIVASGLSSTSSKTMSAAANTYAGQFEPVVVPDLSATVDATNGSDAYWYLWPDPNGSAAPFVIAFLNGVDRPVIEETDPDARFLGTVWRGYIDFGVSQWDSEAAVRANGA